MEHLDNDRRVWELLEKIAQISSHIELPENGFYKATWWAEKWGVSKHTAEKHLNTAETAGLVEMKKFVVSKNYKRTKHYRIAE